jgi:DNA-binding SARP family transcriptional activator
MLTLQLTGTWVLQLDGRPQQLRSQKARALLAYLLLERRRPHRRIVLATLLWPELDQRRALHNLANAVLQLRKLVADGDMLISDADGDTLQLGDYPLDSDVAAFSALEQQLLHHQHQSLEHCAVCCRRLPALLAAVNGPLLPDLSLDDCEDLNDWLLQQREQFHQRLTEWRKVAALFAARHADYAAARDLLQAILQEEPWREEVLLELVRVLCALGERTSALRRIERGITQLRSELNSQPSPDLLLLADDLRAALLPPPPAAHFAVPPLPPTVVARDLLDQVLEHFACRPQQLLTLLGPGGSGKTVLALSAAHQLRGCFTGGIALIHVEPGWDQPALLFAIARAVGVATLRSDTLFEQLIAVLQRGNWLLIFDECELTPQLPTLLGELFNRLPALSVLATSRIPLELKREALLNVGGFGLTTADRPSEAARFVLTRLAALLPTADLDTAAVEQLCQAVGGLPLALELAVHLLRTQPLYLVVEQVSAAPTGLQAPLGDLPPRHQSLRSILDSSWAQIAAEHRPVLAALACLLSPFTVETLIALIGDRAPATTALQHFQLLGLVSAHAAHQSLHPLVRAYARQSDDLRELLGTAELKHSRYFLARLAAHEVTHSAVTSRAVYDQLAAQLPDLQAAWLTACRDGALAELQAAAPGLERLTGIIGWYQPAIELLQQAAALHKAAGLNDSSAVMLLYAANLALQNGQPTVATALIAAARTSAESPVADIRATLYAAVIAFEAGDRSPAVRLTDQFADEAALPAPLRAALAFHRARTAMICGDIATAQAAAEQGVAAAHESDDRFALSGLRSILAQLPARNGDWAAALPLLEQSLTDARNFGNIPILIQALGNAALARARVGRPLGEVLAPARELEAIIVRMGSHPQIPLLQQSLATTYLHVRADNHAEHLLVEALHAARKQAQPAPLLAVIKSFAQLAANRGTISEARAFGRLAADHPATPVHIRNSAAEVLAGLPPDSGDAPTPDLETAVALLLARYPPPA